METWIKLYRKFEEWEWYTDVSATKLFIHFLIKANFKDQNWRGNIIKRGQRLTSVSHLSKETGLTKKQVRTALNKLEKTGEVGKQATSRNTLITVINYEQYQQEGKPEVEQGANNGQTKGEQGANKGQLIKNVKKDKERKECKEREKIFYSSLIPFLDKYDKTLIQDFFRHWSEPIKDGTKMRFELQKTWSLTGRLVTWKKKDEEFNPKQKTVWDKVR